MRIKEKYIKRALEAVRAAGLYNENKNCVPKEYNGYISSFGASIRQAGLLPTILFFENTEASSAQDRSKILRAIEYILELNPNSLKDYLDKAKIEEAAVALKLALRTYKLDKNCGD